MARDLEPRPRRMTREEIEEGHSEMRRRIAQKVRGDIGTIPGEELYNVVLRKGPGRPLAYAEMLPFREMEKQIGTFLHHIRRNPGEAYMIGITIADEGE